MVKQFDEKQQQKKTAQIMNDCTSTDSVSEQRHADLLHSKAKLSQIDSGDVCNKHDDLETLRALVEEFKERLLLQKSGAQKKLSAHRADNYPIPISSSVSDQHQEENDRPKRTSGQIRNRFRVNNKNEPRS